MHGCPVASGRSHCKSLEAAAAAPVNATVKTLKEQSTVLTAAGLLY